MTCVVTKVEQQAETAYRTRGSAPSPSPPPAPSSTTIPAPTTVTTIIAITTITTRRHQHQHQHCTSTHHGLLRTCLPDALLDLGVGDQLQHQHVEPGHLARLHGGLQSGVGGEC